MRRLFLRAGSSDNPNPASVEGANGDQNFPSSFLVFKYVNKQGALIPNMVSKVSADIT